MIINRLTGRAGNLCRKIFRMLGAPEISQRRISEFLVKVGDVTPLPQNKYPRSLAVVIPCYGHASFLPAALKSIASQSRLPDEVIAVDDHSPDCTNTIVEEYFSRLRELGDIRCTLLTNDRNRGQAFSLNQAISAISSELVMILNDDDYLMHDAIATIYELFEQHEDLVMIGGASIHFSHDQELELHSRVGRSTLDAAKMSLSIRQPSDVLNYRRYNDLNMTHSGCCFLKSAWEKVGGYYSNKRKRLVPFSDRDFQLRVNALFPVGVSSDISFSFWRSGSSVDQGRDS